MIDSEEAILEKLFSIAVVMGLTELEHELERKLNWRTTKVFWRTVIGASDHKDHEVRTSIQVSHLYLRALCEAACLTASECGRQAGGEDAFGVPTGIFPSLQGLRPLRRCAAIL